MMESNQAGKKLVVRRGDWFLLLFFTPVVAFFLVAMCVMFYLQPESAFGGRAVKEVVLDFFITLLLFTLLSLVRSFLRPAWLDYLLASLWKKICVFIGILLVMGAVISWLLSR